MIVVSNTSPLTSLAAISQFTLLHELYGNIQIAEEVWEELNAFGRSWPGSQEVANASWVIQKQAKNVDSLRQTAGFYLSDAVYQAILDLAKE